MAFRHALQTRARGEKLLMIEHPEDGQTELFVANGPYPENFEKQQSNWDKWVKAVGKASQDN